MQDRLSAGVYFEMCDWPASEYVAERSPALSALPGVVATSVWNNLRYERDDYARTDADFKTLALHEVEAGFEPPPPAEGIRAELFFRCPRPAQGCLRSKPTSGLLVCLVSPKTEAGKQELRDWADLTHISAIAAAGIEGFTMITAYENAQPVTPRFVHIYEMDAEDPEAAFQRMAPDTIKRRLGPPGTPEFKAWFGHEQLEINYINTFSLVS